MTNNKQAKFILSCAVACHGFQTLNEDDCVSDETKGDVHRQLAIVSMIWSLVSSNSGGVEHLHD